MFYLLLLILFYCITALKCTLSINIQCTYLSIFIAFAKKDRYWYFDDSFYVTVHCSVFIPILELWGYWYIFHNPYVFSAGLKWSTVMNRVDFCMVEMTHACVCSLIHLYVSKSNSYAVLNYLVVIWNGMIAVYLWWCTLSRWTGFSLSLM